MEERVKHHQHGNAGTLAHLVSCADILQRMSPVSVVYELTSMSTRGAHHFKLILESH
jgi:hypothetical protein